MSFSLGMIRWVNAGLWALYLRALAENIRLKHRALRRSDSNSSVPDVGVAVLVPQSHLFLIGAGGLLWRFMGGGRVALCCIAGVWALGGAFQEILKPDQLSPLLVLLLVISHLVCAGCIRRRGGGTCQS